MRQRNRTNDRKSEDTDLAPYSAERSRFPLYEERLIVRALFALVGTTEAPTPMHPCALVCLTGLVLAHTAKEALALPVYLGASPEVAPDGAVCALNLATGTARRWWPRPPKAYTPAPEHVPDLAPHSDYIDLELPDEIIAVLNAWAGPERQEGMTLGDLLNLSASAYTGHAPKLNKHLKDAGVIAEIGERKFANILGAALERVTGDTYLGRHFSSINSRKPSLEYYASYPQAHVSSAYRRALEDLTEANPTDTQYTLDLAEPTPTDHVRVGSHLYPDARTIRRLSEGLHADALQARSKMGTPEGLVRAHNSAVAYIVTMLLALTGARSVWDPFCRLDAFFEDLGAIAVSDKVMDAAHSGRLVIAPTIVFEQIDQYRKHLGSLALRLASMGSPLAKRIESIAHGAKPSLPAFFFLEDIHEWRAVKPQTLAAYHARYWSLSRHALRHRLASDLLSHAVPSEYVVHQLGQLPGGVGPFDAFSVLSPLALRAVLQPALEAIARDHGWCVLKGIQTYGHGPRISA